MARVTFKPGAKIDRMKRSLDNPGTVLKQIGTLMVAESQDAFKQQKFGDTPWPARSTPSVYGIIADFKSGRRAPPSRRFDARPALLDTGALARSIAFKVVGNAVEVGSNLPYAAVHQAGGPVESEEITDDVRRLLWAWLKKQNRKLKSSLGWLLNKKYRGQRLEGEVPARPFVGLTKQTREFAQKAVGVHIMEIR